MNKNRSIGMVYLFPLIFFAISLDFLQNFKLSFRGDKK